MSTIPPVAELSYPCGDPPGFGQLSEIAEGVFWLRMPLPSPLRHVNLWALRDNGGWTIVDTGSLTPDTIELWRALLVGHLSDGPIRRVIATHMHADHVGMAGWLTQACDCRLWMTRLEYLQCRVLTQDTGGSAPEDAVAFYRAAGWNERALERYRARFGTFGEDISGLPSSYRRIRDGESIVIGDNEWKVVVGSGHSPEHACLYSSTLGLLISGDQVLPRISSNVSVYPLEPDADPMTDWLESIAKLEFELPAEVLVLPSHQEPFRGLHLRLRALAAQHALAMQRLSVALLQPSRVVDLFSILFARHIDGQNLHLATGETIASLNHLIGTNQISINTDATGVAWYQAK